MALVGVFPCSPLPLSSGCLAEFSLLKLKRWRLADISIIRDDFIADAINRVFLAHLPKF